MPVLLAFAARSWPALALLAAVALGFVALAQYRAGVAIRAELHAARTELAQARATLADVQAQSRVVELQAHLAVVRATRAHEAVKQALAAREAQPLAPTCEAALVELSDALGGR